MGYILTSMNTVMQHLYDISLSPLYMSPATMHTVWCVLLHTHAHARTHTRTHTHSLTRTHARTLTVQPTYYYRMLKSLSVMADSGSSGTAPLHYFDLRAEGTVRWQPTHCDTHPMNVSVHSVFTRLHCMQYISIPELKHFPTSSSFSFHTWIWLDSVLTGNEPVIDSVLDKRCFSGCKKKRILYRSENIQ